MAIKNGQYKLTTEHRITKLEESIKEFGKDLIEIRDNHLKHLASDIGDVKKQMWWGISVAITILIGVIVDLSLRLLG